MSSEELEFGADVGVQGTDEFYPVRGQVQLDGEVREAVLVE